MFSKKTLKSVIPAALLLTCASAYAADNQVTLADGKTTATWDAVVTALNGDATDLSALKAAVTAAQNTLDRIEPKSEMQTVSWLTKIQEEALVFSNAYSAFIKPNAEATATPVIYYQLQEDKSGDNSLTIAFIKPTIGTWSTANTETFYNNFINPSSDSYKEITYLYIYLGESLDEETNTYKVNYAPNNGSYDVDNYTQAQQKKIISLANTVLNITLPGLKAFQTSGPTAAYKAAQTALEEAEKDLADAQKAQDNYNTITLDGNITATTAIKNYAGSIIGNGYTFTAPAGGAVFTKFTGELSSAAIDGTFAVSSMGATFDNVATWNGTSGTLYDGNGVATEYKSFGELAFAGRNVFGVENGKLTKATTTNKAYSIIVYTSASESTNYFATYAGGKYTNLSNNQTITVGDNVFVKSATNDLDADNVIYNGTANKVVIKDKVNFYCPENITANEVTYNREFKEGFNAVCLPFAINASDFIGEVSLATYEKESDVDEKGNAGKFWFTIQEEGSDIDANTPILLTATNGTATLKTLEGIQIAQTTSQIAVGTVAGESKSFGLLKNAKYGEILGESQKGKVYGLVTNGGTTQFMSAGANAAALPAFRMVITVGDDIKASAAMVQAPRAIGFLDVNGKEVTPLIGGSGEHTAVEAVNEEAALEVVGGLGEITLNSSSDCGNVVVYNIDGKVAANANVVAGTTTVNLPKGVYIVMGKKVLVK